MLHFGLEVGQRKVRQPGGYGFGFSGKEPFSPPESASGRFFALRSGAGTTTTIRSQASKIYRWRRRWNFEGVVRIFTFLGRPVDKLPVLRA